MESKRGAKSKHGCALILNGAQMDVQKRFARASMVLQGIAKLGQLIAKLVQNLNLSGQTHRKSNENPYLFDYGYLPVVHHPMETLFCQYI